MTSARPASSSGRSSRASRSRRGVAGGVARRSMRQGSRAGAVTPSREPRLRGWSCVYPRGAGGSPRGPDQPARDPPRRGDRRRGSVVSRGCRGAPAPDRRGQPARQRGRPGRRRPRARRCARGRRDQRAARARCTASRSRSRTTSRRPGSRWRSAAEERAGTIPATDATVVARMRAAGAILLGKTNCPEYGGGIETDNAVYGRTEQPVRPRAHAGRQLRRRGGGDRGRLLALRPRHRLGRERPPACPLLRPRRAQADLRPRPGHRRDRRPRPDRRARRPAHAGRDPRPLGRATSRSSSSSSAAPTARRRRPARPADGARRGRPARPARRGPDRQRARHRHARDASPRSRPRRRRSRRRARWSRPRARPAAATS